MAAYVAPAEDDGLHGLPSAEEAVTEIRYAVSDFHGCKDNKGVSVAAKLFFRKIRFAGFLFAKCIIYPLTDKNGLKRLKTAKQKGGTRQRTAKNFFLSVVERLPTSFAQRLQR